MENCWRAGADNSGIRQSKGGGFRPQTHRPQCRTVLREKRGDLPSAHTYDNIVRFERVARGTLQLGDSLVEIGLRA